MRLIPKCTIVMAVFVLGSCSKKLDDPSAKTQETEHQKVARRVLTLEEVKSSIDASQSSAPAKKAGTTPIPGVPNSQNYHWDRSFEERDNDNFPIILVPEKNTNINKSFRADMNPKGYRLRAFQHNASHAVKFNIREVHPDVQYITKKAQQKGLSINSIQNDYLSYEKIVSMRDFDGYVIIYGETNNPGRGFRIEKGLITKIYKFQ